MIITYVLVFSAIFLVLMGGLFNFILLQLKQSAKKIAWYESLAIAESGIHYRHWCLNNNVEESCESEKDYFDLDGNLIGHFSLNINSEINCSQEVKQNIESSGWTNDFPETIRTVAVSYGRVSVAKYAFLINDNVWAGADREIRGLYHSNGGIRMDGENQSLVTSAKQDWLCADSFGCNYSSCPSACVREGNACRCPGVFTTTSNSNPDLFQWPAPYFDFESITIDLAEVRNLTLPWPQDKYWPPSADINAQADGYHLIFNQDGTVGVWIITDLDSDWAYDLENGWHNDYFSINSEYLFKTINLDPVCSLIFVEDNLWLDGKVKGKVTVVSANLIYPAQETSVVLPGDIEYSILDGSDGLAVVGEQNILISPDSPNDMELRGIFIAQKGRFGRNHYPWNIKDKLEMYGAIVSNGRVGTKWTSGSVIVSGYRVRENYTDPNLVFDAPAFVPAISPDFQILDWEEVE